MPDIKFLCDEQHHGVFDPPVPAAALLPDFYKQMPSQMSDTVEFNGHGDPNETMKKCMPVLDSMTMGYLITLPTDVHVQGSDNKQFVWAANDFTAISSHPDGQFPGLPIPQGYDATSAYKFHNPWQIVTPKGYSCLFVQPMWRYDLPFYIFPGVVDTDRHPKAVNFPFIMRRDFEGYLKKGTPIAQVVPFRREPFVGFDGVRDVESDKAWARAKLQFSNKYKDHFRSLKSFRFATNGPIVDEGVSDVHTV